MLNMKAFVAAITVALLLVFAVEASRLRTYSFLKTSLEKRNWTSWAFDEVSDPFKLPLKWFDKKLKKYDKKAGSLIRYNKNRWSSRSDLSEEDFNYLVKLNENLLQQAMERLIEVRTIVESRKKEKENRLNQPDQLDQPAQSNRD